MDTALHVHLDLIYVMIDDRAALTSSFSAIWWHVVTQFAPRSVQNMISKATAPSEEVVSDALTMLRQL